MLMDEERCLSCMRHLKSAPLMLNFCECCSLNISVQDITHIFISLKDIREVHVMVETQNDPHRFTFGMLVPKQLLFEKAVEHSGDRA